MNDDVLTLPTDVALEHWNDLADDFEPELGYDLTQEEVAEPTDRDTDALTETLTTLEAGDVVTVRVGTDDVDSGDVALYVLENQTDVAGFETRLTLLERPRADGWTRAYLTGVGHEEFDPWEVVSLPYHVETSTGDMRDFVANGWILESRVPDENGGVSA